MLFATFLFLQSGGGGAVGGVQGCLGGSCGGMLTPKQKIKFQLAKSVDKSTDIAMQICHLKRTIDAIKPRQESVMDRHDKLGQQDHDTKKSHSVQNHAGYVAKSSLNTSTRDWTVLEQLYIDWHASVFADTTTKTPTLQQARILEVVHLRCKYEYFVEQSLPLSADLTNMSAVPLYRLVHGLPGSGKSQVPLWIRDYFERLGIYSWE